MVQIGGNLFLVLLSIYRCRDIVAIIHLVSIR